MFKASSTLALTGRLPAHEVLRKEEPVPFLAVGLCASDRPFRNRNN
jgi:hypothetical protein